MRKHKTRDRNAAATADSTAEAPRPTESAAPPGAAGEGTADRDTPAATATEAGTPPGGATPPAATDLAEALAAERQQAEQLRLEIAQLNERWLRKVAEFENYRRRTARESAELAERAAERVARALLPALDDLERLLDQPLDGISTDILAKGVSMVADKFRGGLDTIGVQPFPSVGQPFDPERHDALTTREEPGREEGEVLEEFLKGYRIGERVMRHAQVIVNRR
jgi:molecular chaperone GrpE